MRHFGSNKMCLTFSLSPPTPRSKILVARVFLTLKKANKNARMNISRFYFTIFNYFFSKIVTLFKFFFWGEGSTSENVEKTITNIKQIMTARKSAEKLLIIFFGQKQHISIF